MRLSKLIAAFAFMFLFALDSLAQNAVLNSCYVMHRDKDMEGKKLGIRFFLNLSVNGKKDQKVWCIIEMAYYEGDDMYFFRQSEGRFKYDGHLAVFKQLTPPYEGTTWNELQLFLPYEEIKKSIGEKNWKKGITYCVKVVDTDGKILMQEWQTSKRMGYTQEIYPWETCYLCHGTGKCGMCYGIGGKTFYTQGFVRCSICSGSGNCSHCGGLGRTKYPTLMSSYDIQVYNGNSYSSGSTTPYYYDNSSSSNGGNYTKPESSSKNTCSICNGTGKCTMCAGRGIRDNEYIGIGTHQCGVCNGKGICDFCGGRGYTYH